jgi:NADPH:quinone reductase-like Zn-dependent oxidoreductase
MRNPDANRELVDDVLRQAANGKLHPPAPSAAKLDEAVSVLRDLEERRVTGKVVLVP